MPTEVTPKRFHDIVQAGFKRMHNFRRARLMFIRNYVGQYYDRDHGSVGTEPLNLIFNAIRVLVPHIVMNFPKHRVHSEYLAYRDYAEILGLALNFNGKQLKLRDTYRRWIVDAIFMLGITKTGLCDSGTAVYFDEYHEGADPGMIYTETVDFDNLVIDPSVRGPISEGAFIGDRIRVSRQFLLDSGLYDNALLERVPSCLEERERDQTASLSMRRLSSREAETMDDEIELVEAWIPKANVIVTLPATAGIAFEQYLRITDYTGPDDGPYTFLSFTPPVPGNPLPVSAVGIWNDLHVMANRMAKKIMDQAARQKDILGYTPANADDAQEVVDAADGEAVSMADPAGVQVYSFGGQKQSNEVHLAQLQGWFNMLAANPQGVGGQALDADSATEATILQGNASIGLEDMKDMVYVAAAAEARKRLFYLHTDPFINLPLAKRTPVTVVTPMGPQTQMQDQQVILTPEARAGDWIDYAVEIEPESMGRMDSATRLRKALEFAVKIIPAAAQAAATCMQMGIPFSFPKFVIRMAKDAGIDWMDEVLYDPEFQLQMQIRMAMGPDLAASKGQPDGGSPDSPAALLQNGQPANVMEPAPMSLAHDAQMGAAAGQAELPIRDVY